MVRREKSLSSLSSNKAHSKTVWSIQDHQGDLPHCVSAGITLIIENLQHVHASLLSPYSEMTAHRPNFSQPPPDLISDEAEYKVEQIRNHCYSRQNKALQYLIKWKRYPESDNMWESASDVHTSDLVRNYHKGTPLESIKAGWLFAVNSIISQPGFPTHLLAPQVESQGLPMQSPPTRSLHHPSIP